MTIPNPSGCGWCGVDERAHVQLWHPVRGWHGWEQPTHEQRRERMLARAEQRKGK